MKQRLSIKKIHIFFILCQVPSAILVAEMDRYDLPPASSATGTSLHACDSMRSPVMAERHSSSSSSSSTAKSLWSSCVYAPPPAS